MAIGTLVFDESSYKSVLCLGHILDKDGRKMSKHLGNVLEPISLMDQHGADAVRWYMLAAGSPWSARRVGHDAISDVVRKTLLTYWNTISFHALYAEASKFELSQSPALSERSMMDQWIISELNALIVEVDKAYNDFDSQNAGRVLARFIDDLSNWYVRRSRRRFWDGDVAALATLHECLTTVTQLLAPMVPFIAEHTWQVLVRPADSGAAASVHLTDFPVANSSLINAALNEQVAMTRRVVELGRSARAESAIKIRQPLQRALISAQGWASLPEDMKAQISDELNVIELEDIANADGDLVDISVKANFKSLGAKYGKAVQDVAKLVAAADATALVKGLRSTGTATLGEFTIDIDDLVVTEVPKSGWMVASHDGESVALDLALSPELIASGNVREVIRLIQERRKSDGFEISDRISVRWSAPAELADVIAAHKAHISDEVLALSFELDASVAAGDNELSVGVILAKA
jgi:isoleucyl-tRNA synthetase